MGKTDKQFQNLTWIKNTELHWKGGSRIGICRVEGSLIDQKEAGEIHEELADINKTWIVVK